MDFKKEFDLLDGLMVNTILMVKYGNKWCHYNIPNLKANGQPRTYGELYLFYSNKPHFKMAKGFIRGDGGDCWEWSHQYFYFDKNTMPKFDERVLKNKFFMSKNLIKSPKVINRHI